MTQFDESQSTNLYLIDQLIVARKRNEVLEAHIETLMEDLKVSSQLLNACVAYMS
jgi:hypothetical protein